MTYLDYAAATPILPSVKKAMLEAMDNFYGNASALHTPGHIANNKIEETRELFAKLINADPSEIIFTSGSTESNNTFINIFRGQKIKVNPMEHESLIDAAKKIAKISDDDYKAATCALANNELGIINDIKKQAKEAHEKNAFFHSDMTQALGKIQIDVKDLDVDYATFSAHKVGGPVGIGVLYVKKDVPFVPLLIGGSQEKYRRSGTYNTAAIIGFGVAIKEIVKNKTWEIYDTKIRKLRDELANRITGEILGSSLNSKIDKSSLPNILNVSFEAAEGESIQLYLDAEGIIVSTGSACAAGNGKPSHVLMALKNDAEVAHSSVRFSFGLESTEKDIEHVMDKLPDIIKRLQGISTIKVKNGK